MARQIEFLRAMSPHNKGDTRVVDDDLADRLVADGTARSVASAFDDRPRDDRMLLPPPRPAPRPARRYLTRG